MKSNKGKINVRVQNAKGITLLALVVTIVVLLILTSIGIKLALGDNGIIGEAKNAKELAEIDEEKGIVKRATTVSLIKSKGSKVEQDTLEKALDDEAGEGRTEVSDVGSIFEVLFIDSNRYYEVDEEGNVSDANEIVKDDYAGDITKGGRCDGSEEKPYEISCIEDLVVLSNMTNGTGIKFENGQVVAITTNKGFENENIKLTRSLNFKSKYSYEDSTRTDFGNINGDDTDGNSLMTEMTTGTGFTPIGRFCGNFNGNNKKIDKILIAIEESEKEAALFAKCDTAIIKDLSISGNISGKWHSAGICGEANGKITIENCINKANITGYNMSAGIIAYTNVTQEDSYIINCINYGNIKSTGRYYAQSGAGGIGGCVQLNILKCKNYGEINGQSSLGGISGRARGTISNCMNEGTIDSKEFNEYSGGIVGAQYFYEIKIYNCVNKGSVKGKGGKGGILGCEIGGSWQGNIITNIYNCYNLGIIGNAETEYAGGILGSFGGVCNIMNLAINNCYTTDKLSGNKIAGIVATYSKDSRIIEKNSIIQNAYYTSNLGVVDGIETKETVICKTELEIKSQAFVNLLNSNIGTNADWKKWKLGSDGYPTFVD